MPRATGRDVREYVKKREEFNMSKNGRALSNLFGYWMGSRHDGGDRYVVFSYGQHYPMFIWQDGVWFENINKFSRTTSRHNTQAHPHEPTVPMTTEQMKLIRSGGFMHMVQYGDGLGK